MRTLFATLCLALAMACSAQVVTMRQVTNVTALKTNTMIYSNLYYLGSDFHSSWDSGGFYIRSLANNYLTIATNAIALGDSSLTAPTAIGGAWVQIVGVQSNSADIYVAGVAYDQNGVPFASQRYASNAVQVLAGAGTFVTASGSGGVQTFTITSTAGAGATNAISAVQTNGGIGGLGLTSLAINNGYGITVSGVSNGGVFTLTFTVDFTSATNYANSIGALATNLAYIIGANGSNFTYQIAANGTTYVNTATVNLTNALAAKQDGYANLSALGNSGIQFPGISQLQSNMNQILWNLQRMTVATNSSASNLVINVRTNKYYFTATNNITVTNLVGIAEGVASDVTIIIEPQLIPRGITYPTLGGASFGIYANTNDNSAMWTTLTNGNRYALTISAFGTNTFWSISRWK